MTPGLNKRWESFDPTRVRNVRGAVAVKILCVPVALTGCSITREVAQVVPSAPAAPSQPRTLCFTVFHCANELVSQFP